MLLRHVEKPDAVGPNLLPGLYQGHALAFQGRLDACCLRRARPLRCGSAAAKRKVQVDPIGLGFGHLGYDGLGQGLPLGRTGRVKQRGARGGLPVADAEQHLAAGLALVGRLHQASRVAGWREQAALVGGLVAVIGYVGEQRIVVVLVGTIGQPVGKPAKNGHAGAKLIGHPFGRLGQGPGPVGGGSIQGGVLQGRPLAGGRADEQQANQNRQKPGFYHRKAEYGLARPAISGG